MIENENSRHNWVFERTDVYSCAFDFRCWTVADIYCYLYDPDTKTLQLLEQDKDYTVTLNNGSPGGLVALATSPGSVFADGMKLGNVLSIMRILPISQDIDLPENGKLPSAGLENQLDKMIMICQQMQEQIGRAIVVPPSRESGMTTDEFKDEIRSDIDAAVDAAREYRDQASGYKDSAFEYAGNAGGYAFDAENHETTASGYMDVAYEYMSAAGEYAASAANVIAGGMPIHPLSGCAISGGTCTINYENGHVYSGAYPVVSGTATATVFKLTPAQTVQGGKQCTFELHLRHTNGNTAQFVDSMIYRNSGGVYDPAAGSSAIAAVVDTEQNLTIRPVTEGGVMYYMINEATVRKLQTGGN